MTSFSTSLDPGSMELEIRTNAEAQSGLNIEEIQEMATLAQLNYMCSQIYW